MNLRLDDLVSRSVKQVTVSDRRGIRGVKYSEDGDVIGVEVNRRYVKGQSDSYLELRYPFRLMDRSMSIIYDKNDQGEYSIREVFVIEE